MGKHGAAPKKSKSPWPRFLALFVRKPPPPTCTWCGATENLTQVNAAEYGKPDPIWVCTSVIKCTKNYWEKSKWPR